VGKTVTVVASGVGSTSWHNLDHLALPFAVEIDCTVSGTVTYNLELTNSYYLTPGTTVIVQPTTVAAATASTRTPLTSPCRAWRLTITAGAGSVTAEAIQAGL
jgi:hypothetical protein